MDSVFDQGSPPPCPAPFNLAASVLARASATPEKIALAVLTPSGAERWSYARIEAAVRGAATGLQQAGLEPGERLLLRLGNTPAFPIAYLAAITIGAIPVPTSALLTAPEVSKIAPEITPRLVVADDGLSLPDPCPCPVIPASAFIKSYENPPAAYEMGDPNRAAYIIYTSGTSGQPRAVTHAHRAIWARRMMWQGWYGLAEDDRLLHAGAFNWTYTLGTGLMDPWAIGATALIPGKGVTPAQLPLLLKRHDASIFAAAPGVYRQMLRHNFNALPKLRHGLSAGEKLPETTRAAWHKATGTAIFEAFGMSECSTFVSGSPARPAPRGSLGYPQPGRRVAVLDDEGAPVPIGTPGTLAVAAEDPGLMLRYWNAAGETTARYQGPWFLTGDTVSMAEDGALTYLGRGDDMMNAGGVRVSPIEVEQVLNSHPEIEECAAAEVQVKADTSVIAAFYVSAAALDSAALGAFASTALAGYKVPRIFTRVEALPKNANGKILRRQLREAWEGQHDQA